MRYSPLTPGEIAIDREEQNAAKARAREVITANPAYDEIQAGLKEPGFLSKEGNPALALRESLMHQLFVMIHMNRDTGRFGDCVVKTFEGMEGFE